MYHLIWWLLNWCSSLVHHRNLECHSRQLNLELLLFNLYNNLITASWLEDFKGEGVLPDFKADKLAEIFVREHKQLKHATVRDTPALRWENPANVQQLCSFSDWDVSQMIVLQWRGLENRPKSLGSQRRWDIWLDALWGSPKREEFILRGSWTSVQNLHPSNSW